VLFLIYAEMMMIEAMEDLEYGVNVGGKLIKDIRFADDQGMVASTEFGLQQLMNGLVKTAKEYDMKLNIKKTKVMRVSREGDGGVNIINEGERLEQVQQFRYLGALITSDGRCEMEIKTRIGMAKAAFNNRKELLSRRMNKNLKKRIIKTVIWSVALYASETWTLKKEEIRKLEAFEMWVWRRMENVTWQDRKTNEEVLQAVGENRSLVNIIMRRKKNWIGHILRGDNLMKDVMEGRMIGKRTRGRKRLGMLNGIMVESYADMKKLAFNREEWRRWMPYEPA
jgi:hypothetical protein